MKHILFLTLFLLSFIHAESQNKIINLNEGSPNVAEMKTRNLPAFELKDAAQRARAFTLNKALQTDKDIAIGDELMLELFADKRYKAKIDKIGTDINGTLSVTATLTGYPLSYCSVITSSDGNNLVVVEIPELKERYITRVNAGTESGYLLEIGKSAQTELPCGAELLPPDDEFAENEATTANEQAYKPEVRAGVNDPAVIDLMIVYTPAAKAWSATNEGGINNTIAGIMSRAEQVVRNSNVGMTIRLVHSAEVNYVESGNSVTDVDRITYTNDGYMDEVHQWRDRYAADVVVLLTKADDTGGYGWILGSSAGRPAYAFSMTRVQQATSGYTTIHEIGHNMGLGHHKKQTTQPGPGLFPYSAGWRWKGTDNNMYCTVMTYESSIYFEDGLWASRVPYFSDPNTRYEGISTGHSTEADAARSLRETKHVVAAYRSSTECNAPTGLEATNITMNAATLTWNAVYGAQSYTLEYKEWSELSYRPGITVTTNSYNMTGLTPGIRYFWRVKTNCQAGSSPVSVITNFYAADHPSTCVGKYEPNETMATAYPISASIYYASIGTPTDKDYYKFTTISTRDIVVKLQNLTKDYDLKLYNSAGAEIGSSAKGGTTNESITKPNLEVGTYYVYVYGYGGAYDANSCYSLQVSYLAPSGDVLAIENARPDVNTAVELYPNPVEDILYIKGMGYGQEDLQLTITDTTGRIVKRSSTKAEETISVDVSTLPAGVYFFSVRDKAYRFIKK